MSITKTENMKFRSPFALLLLAGLFIATETEGTVTSSKCVLEEVTDDVTITLPDPASDYCGHSSVTLSNLERYRCKNNGNDCENSHYVSTFQLDVKFCIAHSYETISGSTTVVGANGCTATVSYTFVNITGCACRWIERLADVWIIFASVPCLYYLCHY